MYVRLIGGMSDCIPRTNVTFLVHLHTLAHTLSPWHTWHNSTEHGSIVPDCLAGARQCDSDSLHHLAPPCTTWATWATWAQAKTPQVLPWGVCGSAMRVPVLRSPGPLILAPVFGVVLNLVLKVSPETATPSHITTSIGKASTLAHLALSF